MKILKALCLFCVSVFCVLILYFSWCIHMGSNLGIILTSKYVVALHS